MKLDITNIYIDRRFKTKNSKSDIDFSIELPRSFNVPDGVVDERNNRCYISVSCGNSVRDANFTLECKNYEGANFATALAAAKLNLAVAGFVPLPVLICTYDIVSNLLTISMTDARTAANILPTRLQILTDDTLTLGPPGISNPSTINTIIRNTNQPVIKVAESYKFYIDLFQTRNWS